MAILQTCCCWNNVRSGSKAAGIYTMFMSILVGAVITYNLTHVHSLTDVSQRYGLNSAQSSVAHSDCLWLVSTVTVCALMFLSSCLLFYGIHKDRRFWMVPWLIVASAMVAWDTICLIYQCVVFGMLTFNIIQMVVWLGLTLLNLYCILCVISQYQELKAGRGTLEYINSQRPAVIYNGGIQQVHFTQGPIVMQYPGGTVTSQTSLQQPSFPPTTITTTVSMAPPDYQVATGSLPTYADATTNLASNTALVPLISEDKSRAESQPPAYMP